MLPLFDKHFTRDTLDPPDDADHFKIPRRTVEKAMKYAVRTNEIWKQHARMYAVEYENHVAVR